MIRSGIRGAQAQIIEPPAREIEKSVARVPWFQAAIPVLILLGAVLSPQFTLFRGFYKPRAEDFVLLGVLVAWLASLCLGNWGEKHAVHSRGFIIVTRIMAGMFYIAIISISIGTIAFQQRMILNDWMILPMLARYWLIFLVGQWVRERTSQRLFTWGLVVSFGISAMVGVLQHFNLLGINSWLTPVYVRANMQDVGLDMVIQGLTGARVVGTHGDAREYGYLLVVGMGVCLAIFMNIRKGLIRWVALGVLGMCLWVIPYTGSRTPFLTGGIVVLGTILFLWRANRRVGQIAGLLILLVVVAAFVYPAYQSDTFTSRVLTVKTESYNHSVGARIRDFVTPFQIAMESPIIWLTGRGPSKADVRTDAHGDIGWYFYRFGLPGLILYLTLIFSVLRFSWRSWAQAADPWGKTLSMAAFLLAVTWLVFIFGENIVKDAQIMGLNMLILGAGLTWSNQGTR